jgi:hypothetical protein
LRKLEGSRYKAADTKYKEGFKSTDEERVKERCNEILNDLNLSVQGGKTSCAKAEKRRSSVGAIDTKHVDNDDTCNDQDPFNFSENSNGAVF